MRRNAMKQSLIAVVITAVLGGAAARVANANESTGTVSGTVATQTNPADYHVVINNESTGLTRTVGVSDEGAFRLSSLPIGNYRLRLTDPSGAVVRETKVRVTIGGNIKTHFDTEADDNVERISVMGRSLAMVNTAAVDTGLNMGEAEFDRLPIGRDATSIALLAPTTTSGDSAFNSDGNLASFGGASVAENAYYINGLNVTNFRNGLGGSSIPFEFYDQFKVKTGGYSAQYGRSLGGVVDAVTKSGTNEFHGGANVFYTPESLYEQAPDTRYRNGRVFVPNSEDEHERSEANIWLSGPLIKDKLFFYALYNPRDVKSENLNAGNATGSGAGERLTKEKSDDAFWGANVDWYITNDHIIEITAFSDKRDRTETSYNYDYQRRHIADGADGVRTTYSRGGDNWLVKYTGYLTDDLTVTALYGENKYDLDDVSDNALTCPYVVDGREDSAPGYMGTYPSCAGDSYTGITHSEDERDAWRIDFEWVINENHTLKFGYDSETLKSKLDEFTYSDNSYYRIYPEVAEGAQLNNGWVNDTGESFAYYRLRSRQLSGNFKTKSNSYYIEDQWQITDDLFASIGIRNDSFENQNADGDNFVKIDDQWAPRLGITWDVEGDGSSKLYANWGRYYLPIPNNTNVRVAGNEVDWQEYYRYAGLDANGVPIAGQQLGDRMYTSDGAHDVGELADKDLDPMYQDEWILGYEKEVQPGWVVGLKGTHRELKRAIDDVCTDELPTCVLFNPGHGLTITEDGEQVNYSAEDLGFDKAKRKYDAVTLDLKHISPKLNLGASYTWSHLRGNTEGFVKSDNGQDDAGITQDWDMPELMDGAYGDLPNDRRHVFKLYGSYLLTDAWSAGWNFSMSSGRPVNAFGIGYPTGTPAYGDTYYLAQLNDEGEVVGYNHVPRGSMGRTSWVTQLDLSTSYTMQVNEIQLKWYLDVFNVLDADSSTEVYEVAESGSEGVADSRYGLTTAYQTPRSVRFGFEASF